MFLFQAFTETIIQMVALCISLDIL